MHFIRQFFKNSTRKQLEGARIEEDKQLSVCGGTLEVKDRSRGKEWAVDQLQGRPELLKSSPSKSQSRGSTPSGSQTSMSTIIEGRPGVMMREVKMSSSRHVAQVLPGLILGRQKRLFSLF